MPYLGNEPATAFTSTTKDTFSGDASTTDFTLSRAATQNAIRVVVENVVQDPGVAYTCSGTTLSFTSAPPTGTNNIYVVHLGPPAATIAPPTTINNTTTFTGGIAAPLVLDRETSDGTLIDFRKDGTTVASISVASSDNISFDAITNGGAGLHFWGGGGTTPYITPRKEGSLSDGEVSFGRSTERFKDIFLSGGVYVGGTTSSNYLEDYEEGTFTPTYTGSTSNPSGVTYDPTVGNEGVYVKVGKSVFIQINIRTDAISNVGSGNLKISGLPFAAASLSAQGGYGSFAIGQVDAFAGEAPLSCYVDEGGTTIQLFFRSSVTGSTSASQCSDLGTGSNDNLLRISGTYYSTA